MPGGNRRGPGGNGPMTGRQVGYCAGHIDPGGTSIVHRGSRSGRNAGVGSGFGRQQRNQNRASGIHSSGKRFRFIQRDPVMTGIADPATHEVHPASHRESGKPTGYFEPILIDIRDRLDKLISGKVKMSEL